MISGVCHPVSAGALGQHGAARKRCGQENRVANTKSAGNTGKDGRSYVRRLNGTRVAARFAAIQLGDFMRQLPFATALATLAATGAWAAERPILLKEAPGRAIVENNCGGCHSLDYIRINAPFMNRQNWTAEVNKMINTFGAPIPKMDADMVIDYLTANYGEK